MIDEATIGGEGGRTRPPSLLPPLGGQTQDPGPLPADSPGPLPRHFWDPRALIGAFLGPPGPLPGHFWDPGPSSGVFLGPPGPPPGRFWDPGPPLPESVLEWHVPILGLGLQTWEGRPAQSRPSETGTALQ